MKWTVKHADILSEPADVLICSANVQLNLSGGVGGEILRRYGDDMQKELRAYLSTRGLHYVAPGDVVCVSPGGTHFKHVLHAVAIDAFYGSSDELVCKTVEKALRMAAVQKAGKVALTALATGFGPFDAAQFAQAIKPLLCREFGPIEEVVICVLKTDQAEEMQAILGRGQQERVAWQGGYLQVVVRNGYECVERRGISGIVGIVAVTDERRLVLVEQFRPPVQRRVVELPAGLVGDIAEGRDESIEEAARRELLEETGFQAGAIEPLVEGPGSAGLSSERITLVRARGLVRLNDGGGDDSEDIAVHEVPLDGLAAWLQRQRERGVLVDLKIYAALALIA